MSSEVGALIIVIIFIVLVIWAVSGPSERDFKRERRREEHETEMLELEAKRREAQRQADIPSGRGRVVKARRR